MPAGYITAHSMTTKKRILKTTSLLFFLLFATLLGCMILYFTSEHTINKSLWSALGLVTAIALQRMAVSEQKSM